MREAGRPEGPPSVVAEKLARDKLPYGLRVVVRLLCEGVLRHVEKSQPGMLHTAVRIHTCERSIAMNKGKREQETHLLRRRLVDVLQDAVLLVDIGDGVAEVHGQARPDGQGLRRGGVARQVVDAQLVEHLGVAGHLAALDAAVKLAAGGARASAKHCAAHAVLLIQITAEDGAGAAANRVCHHDNVGAGKGRGGEVGHVCAARAKVVEELLAIGVRHAIDCLWDGRIHELRVRREEVVLEIAIAAVEELRFFVLAGCGRVGHAACEVEVAKDGGEAGIQVVRPERPEGNGACEDVAAAVARLVDEKMLDAGGLEGGQAGVEGL